VIQSAMYFALGFLVCGLLGLIVLHFVWRRTVRLTSRRIHAAVPTEISDIRAEKDRMRAEFALATRKLEKLLDAEKEKNVRQRLDLTARDETLRAIVAERDAKAESAGELLGREEELRRTLRSREDELLRNTSKLREVERLLDQRSKELEAYRETLHGQAGGREKVEALSKETDTVLRLQQELTERSSELETLRKRLTEQEEENATLRIGLVNQDLTSKAAAQSEASEAPNAPADSTAEAMPDKLEQASLSARIFELEARNAEAHAEIERLTIEHEQTMAMQTSGSDPALQALRGDKAMLESRLADLAAERDRLLAENAELRARGSLAAGPADIEIAAESETLRDELKDIAASVAHMTALIEGEGSPITALVDQAGGDVSAASIAARIQKLRDKVDADRSASAG